MKQLQVEPDQDLRVVLLGDFTAPSDEGMKKTAVSLAHELSKHHRVKTLNLKEVFSTSFWSSLKSFDPHIVHYIPGPSVISLILAKAIKLYCPGAKVVMSALYPTFYGLRGLFYGPSYALSSLLQPLIPLLKPDLILVQSPQTEKLFAALGCNTLSFLPCGVDTERFKPIPPQDKEQLRQKYGLNQSHPIALHVGPIIKWRNVQVLSQLRQQDVQVIIVGSTTTTIDHRTCHQLEADGCLIWKQYLENIEEFYGLADFYIFPTVDKAGSIELPLSVLEAMSCNLPVISSRFGALPQVFSQGEGLLFIDHEHDLTEAVAKMKSTEVKTRDKVLPYSWDRVATKLEEIYKELVFSKQKGGQRP